MKKLGLLLLGVGFLTLSTHAYAATATADIKGTAEGSPISGQLTLEEKEGGLEITANVANVPAGEHGFHIHENGSCEDNGNAAGSHFNPDKVQHGDLEKDGFEKAHAGDLGNITIAEDGTGTYSTFVKGLSLTEGKYNVDGKSVILHEKVDNFGQPTGNAGGRIACGVIKK